jgi:hypothetical protein
MSKFLVLCVSAVLLAPAFAQKLNVKIVHRQSNETDYSYVVPGHLSTNSNANVNCFGSAGGVGCNGSSSTTGYVTPAHEVSFRVRGATFSLQLPDGRVAVVNCESKVDQSSLVYRRRSCRVPLVRDVEADFSGDKAKLKWSVSLDGKKMESETYKILGVLTK